MLVSPEFSQVSLDFSQSSHEFSQVSPDFIPKRYHAIRGVDPKPPTEAPGPIQPHSRQLSQMAYKNSITKLNEIEDIFEDMATEFGLFSTMGYKRWHSALLAARDGRKPIRSLTKVARSVLTAKLDDVYSDSYRLKSALTSLSATEGRDEPMLDPYPSSDVPPLIAEQPMEEAQPVDDVQPVEEAQPASDTALTVSPFAAVADAPPSPPYCPTSPAYSPSSPYVGYVVPLRIPGVL